MSIQQQLNNILRRKDAQLHAIAKDICSAIKEKLQENLKRYWYDGYSPKSYTRTWELFDSIEGTIERNKSCDYTIRVFFDPDKIHAVQNDDGWNSHMGFDSQAFTSGLVSSIEDGVGGSYNNPRHGSAAHMIEFTEQWAQTYARQLLRERL